MIMILIVMTPKLHHHHHGMNIINSIYQNLIHHLHKSNMMTMSVTKINRLKNPPDLVLNI